MAKLDWQNVQQPTNYQGAIAQASRGITAGFSGVGEAFTQGAGIVRAAEQRQQAELASQQIYNIATGGSLDAVDVTGIKGKALTAVGSAYQKVSNRNQDMEIDAENRQYNREWNTAGREYSQQRNIDQDILTADKYDEQIANRNSQQKQRQDNSDRTYNATADYRKGVAERSKASTTAKAVSFGGINSPFVSTRNGAVTLDQTAIGKAEMTLKDLRTKAKASNAPEDRTAYTDAQKVFNLTVQEATGVVKDNKVTPTVEMSRQTGLQLTPGMHKTQSDIVNAFNMRGNKAEKPLQDLREKLNDGVLPFTNDGDQVDNVLATYGGEYSKGVLVLAMNQSIKNGGYGMGSELDTALLAQILANYNSKQSTLMPWKVENAVNYQKDFSAFLRRKSPR